MSAKSTEFRSRSATTDSGTGTGTVGLPNSAHDTGGSLRGTMNTLQLALTVLAMSAPIGNVTGVLPLGITRGNGIGTPVIYAFVGMIFLLFAVGFTTMTRNLPKPGAFYTYITAGLSRTLGLGTGFLAAFTYLVYMVGSYAFFGVSVKNVLSAFGAPTAPWWLWGAICCVIVTTLGHFNVELSGKVLAIFMVMEVVLVMLFNAPVLFTGGPHGYQIDSFEPTHVLSGDLGVATLFAITCFLGFESSAIYRDEVKRPERTIPRATYLAIGSLGGFYILTSWALVTFWGPSHVAAAGAANPTILFNGGFRHYMGNTFTQVMTALVVTSVFAGALSTHNSLSRYLYSLGRDGILPSFLGKGHGRHGSPANASAFATTATVMCTLPFLLSGLDAVAMYSSMFALGTFALLILFTLTTISVIRYFRIISHSERLWNTVIAPILALAGLMLLITLTSTYYSMSIDASQWLATGQQLLLVAVIVIGILVGLRWRKTRPAVYRRIGGGAGEHHDIRKENQALSRTEPRSAVSGNAAERMEEKT
ncbi:APC family permease [Streptomyces iranensis]|uniref:Amino acid permease-associated region n=1 Tax=Streptomyces iranensis TaxID=576784 RepID=A0A061ACH2_9ACTN|nr:APC family permease [Streptomyces iranensis]MBP2067516.1 amino acid transporter [Streptomyces iranensis]CDR17557.1 amino acid permease-associated region [Streptomyces iranensis]